LNEIQCYVYYYMYILYLYRVQSSNVYYLILNCIIIAILILHRNEIILGEKYTVLYCYMHANLQKSENSRVNEKDSTNSTRFIKIILKISSIINLNLSQLTSRIIQPMGTRF
jgi:DNA replication protein DnaD